MIGYKFGKTETGSKAHIVAVTTDQDIGQEEGIIFFASSLCGCGGTRFHSVTSPKKGEVCKRCVAKFRRIMDSAKQLEIEACED